MNSEFLLNLKDLSIEIIVISLIVFGLTMLIKWPIKKATSKLNEDKRKAINTVIVFIPMLLAFVLNILYFGLFKKTWLNAQAFESAGSTYILAVAIYAVYSRIVIVIKGAKGQKTTEVTDELSKKTIRFIKQNVKTISKTLKVNEDNLEKLVTKISNLLTIRDEINSSILLQDITATEKLNKEITQLQLEEKNLITSIDEEKKQLSTYEKTLKTK